MKGLDQGTVLFGLRSDKYPGIPCYGIVITASCDISNDKVAKLCFLIGVDARRWFCTEYAYHQVYDTKIENLFKPVEDMCRKFSLDANAIRRKAIRINSRGCISHMPITAGPVWTMKPGG